MEWPINTRLLMLVLAYLVPTFVLDFVWHLKLFADYYRTLEIYRLNILIPVGFTSMLLQALCFAWAYPRLVGDPTSFRAGLGFAMGAALLSWTYTTLAVGAKHHMTSVSRFMSIETAFTLAQFVLVGVLWPLAARLAPA